MERMTANSDDADPDRSWRWPVEHLADAVIDLYPQLDTIRRMRLSMRHSVMFGEFCVHSPQFEPPSQMCAPEPEHREG